MVPPRATRFGRLLPVAVLVLTLAAYSVPPVDVRAQSVASWRILGEGAQLRSPMGVVVDVAGSIYVADAGNHRVVKLDPNGRQVAAWGTQGAAPGQFDNPSGIAVDGAGYVYVADTFNHRVQKLTPDGQVVLVVGELGARVGQFRDPAGIAVDSEGTMYVADTRNNRVQKLSPEGEPLADWGTATDGEQPVGGQASGGQASGGWPSGERLPGEPPIEAPRPPVFDPFRRPKGLALDVYGRLIVADTDDVRIALVSAETGRVFDAWASSGSPRGAAVDAYGRVYVADAYGHRVQLLGAEGAALAQWGTEGGQAGEFRSPSGVALDRGGALYVADTGNHRLQRLAATGQ